MCGIMYTLTYDVTLRSDVINTCVHRTSCDVSSGNNVSRFEHSDVDATELRMETHWDQDFTFRRTSARLKTPQTSFQKARNCVTFQCISCMPPHVFPELSTRTPWLFFDLVGFYPLSAWHQAETSRDQCLCASGVLWCDTLSTWESVQSNIALQPTYGWRRTIN